MDNAQLKKYAPFVVGGGALFLAVLYYKRNSALSSPQVSTGYTVVAPPDNSAAVASAASQYNARMQFAASGLQAMTQLTANEQQIQGTLDLANINATRDISLAGIAKDVQTAQFANDLETTRLTQANQLEATRIASSYQLQSEAQQQNSALAIQHEQNLATIQTTNANAAVQNNAIRAQRSASNRASTTSAIVSVVGMAAMLMFCYDTTEINARGRRRYFHGTDYEPPLKPALPVYGPPPSHPPAFGPPISVPPAYGPIPARRRIAGR